MHGPLKGGKKMADSTQYYEVESAISQDVKFP